MPRSARIPLVCGATVALLSVTPDPASAYDHIPQASSAHATRQKHRLGVSVTFSGSSNSTGSSTGPLGVSGGNWTPPPCWYAPKWTPKQFKKETEKEYRKVVNSAEQPDYAKEAAGEVRDTYRNGKYKNYNIKQQGKGMWWGAVENPDEPDVLKRISCDKPAFWEKNGQQPKVKNAISPKILAGLAYQHVRVPDTKVSLNPNTKQTVNLDTWAWLDKATFKPVSVTATFNGGGLHISATATATPVSLRLEPGTQDATLHPPSGECPIHKDGSIGEPYTPSKLHDTPPCGITYLRSNTGASPYRLRATATWKISWHGTGGTGGNLPNGVFGTTRDITVQEVQSVDR